MAKKKRTVIHSSAGKKLYAVRNEEGEFTDIQTYQRAQAADMRQKSAAELEAAAKKKPKKAAKKKAAKKKSTAKKAKAGGKKKKKKAKRGK